MLIYDFDVEKWNDKAPWNLIDWIEFEIEYIGKTNININIDKIYKLYSNLVYEYDFNYYFTVQKLLNSININKLNNYGFQNSNFNLLNTLPKAREYSLEEYTDRGYNLLNYNVRLKIDGKRCLLYIKNKKIYIIEKTISIINSTEINYEYLFDCEYYNDTFYILHILIYKNINVTFYNENERNKIINYFISNNDIGYIKKCPTELNCNNLKKFYDENKVLYNNDGIILTTNETYHTQLSLKWKPRNKMTIDFLVMECPIELIGKKPYYKRNENDNLWLLFVSTFNKKHNKLDKLFYKIDTSKCKPIAFSPYNNKDIYIWSVDSNLTPNLNKKIVELGFENNAWIFHRIRKDRPSCFDVSYGGYFGNNVNTANSIWKNINSNDIFEIEYLNDDINEEIKSDEEVDDDIININFNIKKLINNSNSIILIENIKINLSHLYKSKFIKYYFYNIDISINNVSTKFNENMDIYISNDFTFINNLKHGGYLVSDDFKINGEFKHISGNIYQKKYRGFKTQHADDIRNDNEHLKVNNSLYSNIKCKYINRFSKTLTNNLLYEDEYPDECPFNYKINHNLGIVITIMESITNISDLESCIIISEDFYELSILKSYLKSINIQIHEYKNNTDFDHKKIDFYYDVLIILHTFNDIYTTLLNLCNPAYYIIKCNENSHQNGKLPRGRHYHIPYQEWDKTELVIYGERLSKINNIKYVNFGYSTLCLELRGFNMYTRSQAYKNANLIDNFDDCYDCKYSLITFKKFIKKFNPNGKNEITLKNILKDLYKF